MYLLNPARAVTEQPDIRRFHIHTHEEYELYCFLRGKAKYFVEGTVYPLHPGDILLMKQAEAHTLLSLGDAPYERITVHFSAPALEGAHARPLLAFLNDRPLGRHNRYPGGALKHGHWMHYLEMICRSKDFAVQQMYLTVLLSELRESGENLASGGETQYNIAEVITYINSHLEDDLSVDALCTRFHISPSHFNRRFRAMTGASPGQYVRTKRLHRAKQLLSEGENPTGIYERCGFSEYSAFFRAYKDTFGVSPKQDHAPQKHL